MKHIVLISFLLGTILLISGCQKQSDIAVEQTNPISQATEVEPVEAENMVSENKNATELNFHAEPLNISNEEQTRLDKALENIAVPSGYSLVGVSHGNQNEQPVTIYRYTKNGEKNEGGEHFSITMNDSNNKLIGFTTMDLTFNLEKGLISEAEANRIAIEFLNKVEPGLVENSSHLWTGQHDETISVEGNEYTISGMKYKCYVRSSDLYYWVVVGQDGRIITFEQDIVWSNNMSERISEQWLHDWWRAKNDNF